jgi:formylaminopyrimidine deformylase / aminopyrimidine aminohydrolase
VIAGTVAADLLAGSAAPWSRLPAHPFIAQAGDGSLLRGSFDRWLVADHFFVVGFRRFLTGLVTLAPDEHAADVLAAGLGALQTELDLFRRDAAAPGLDLAAEPGPIAIGYTAFLRASLQDGYPVALAVLYGAEKAYFDAWSAVRATAAGTATTGRSSTTGPRRRSRTGLPRSPVCWTRSRRTVRARRCERRSTGWCGSRSGSGAPCTPATPGDAGAGGRPTPRRPPRARRGHPTDGRGPGRQGTTGVVP